MPDRDSRVATLLGMWDVVEEYGTEEELEEIKDQLHSYGIVDIEAEVALVWE